VVCGDFNATPSSPAYRRLAARFLDAQLAAPEHEPCNTWFSTWPVGRIDHVFVGGAVTVRHVEVPRTSLARMASDHLPVLADLVLS
jgi:endonuclease/exonuclease/phosphatase family metal-dependent hydrolase